MAYDMVWVGSRNHDESTSLFWIFFWIAALTAHLDTKIMVAWLSLYYLCIVSLTLHIAGGFPDDTYFTHIPCIHQPYINLRKISRYLTIT